MSTKKYSIPIFWQSYKRVEVEAENLQDAALKALRQFLSEPDELYLEDSFEIDPYIEEEIPDEKIDYKKLYEDL